MMKVRDPNTEIQVLIKINLSLYIIIHGAAHRFAYYSQLMTYRMSDHHAHTSVNIILK